MMLANAGTKPSDHFRIEHKEIKSHLKHIEDLNGTLTEQNVSYQKKNMKQIVAFFEEHIAPHAAWEEQKLYPAIDRRNSKEREAFTTSMRYEHKIIETWVKNLKTISKSNAPDIKLFMRKTDQLLGLVYAHFEEEEEVLLPILDQKMTQDQFKEEIGTK